MTPVLLTLDDGFLQPPEGKPLGRVRDPANLLDQPVYQRWNARTDAPALRWLGCCFNDLLLRTLTGRAAAAVPASPSRPRLGYGDMPAGWWHGASSSSSSRPTGRRRSPVHATAASRI